MKIYSAMYSNFAYLDTLDGVSGRAVVWGPHEVKEKGILILHGGGDISPTLYKAKPSRYNGAGQDLSMRDLVEKRLALHFLNKNWPVFGICRGMQLLTALHGGKLVQHVTNHAGANHLVETIDKQQFVVNSAHHQMCNFDNVKLSHTVTAWTPKPISDMYVGEDGEEIPMEREPEAVHFHDTNCYGIQGHPEWMPESSNMVQWVLQQLTEKVTHVIL